MSSNPDNPTPNVNAIVRYALTLSSIAMLVMAGLTFTGRMPFAPWIGWLFVAIAVIDTVIAWAIFGGNGTRGRQSF